LRLDPQSVRAGAELGAAYKAKGQLAAALAEETWVIRQDPKYAMAYFVRGSVYADQGNHGKAYADAEKLLLLSPDSAPGKTLLAKEAIHVEKCARAVEVLKPGSENSTDSQTLFLLGRAYQCSGQADEASRMMARYTAALEKERSKAEDDAQSANLVKQAQQEAQANRLNSALELIQKALEASRDNADAYALRAKLYYSAKRLPEAEEAIGRALAINPIQPEYLYVLGKLQARQGKQEEALETFRQVTVINPKESDAFYEMGLIFKQRKDEKRAVAALKKALELSPQDPDYRAALAEITLQNDPH
jgi:tetratricopeptide (TPR) repeat protein